MEREEVISEIGKPILRPLGFLQMFCLIAIISTPFVWLWDSWYLAWRTGLTGLIGFIIAVGIYKLIEMIIKEGVNDELDKMDKGKPTTSKFRERLESAQKARQFRS